LESDDTFEQADVVYKLDAAEKKSKMNDEDVVSFGLEDEEGNVVKVYVDAEQSKEFESALSSMLAGMDDEDNDDNPDEPSTLEIAEILFKLKDNFNIIDVEWGEIPEDEEEEQQIDDDDSKDDDSKDDDSKDDDSKDDSDMTADSLEDSDGDKAAGSALQQVIDTMKADAEAKKAEAEARKAEAESKTAEYTAQSAASKVKQEEEVLDMEAHYKDKKDEDKEAKRLAKLAKYKHDQASEAETSISAENEEVSVSDLADLISKKLREN